MPTNDMKGIVLGHRKFPCLSLGSIPVPLALENSALTTELPRYLLILIRYALNSLSANYFPGFWNTPQTELLQTSHNNNIYGLPCTWQHCGLPCTWQHCGLPLLSPSFGTSGGLCVSSIGCLHSGTLYYLRHNCGISCETSLTRTFLHVTAVVFVLRGVHHENTPI